MPSTNLAVAEEEAFWFDEAAAGAACDFFETYLRHTEAEWYGKPFKLQAWQRDDIVRPLFGWKRADGTRRYRRLHLEVGRKNGKTELAAGIALLLLVADGEPGAQVYSMAVDKDQAKIVFNKATTMVQLNDELRTLVEPLKTALYCSAINGAFKPLSSTPASKHGFSPSASVADEIHEWPSGELAEVVHEGMGARRQPVEVEITTAGVYGQGYGWERHDYAVKVRDGIVHDPSLLVVIYAADEEDDWTDEATWRKANPGLGVSPKLEFLRAEFAEASESPRKENRFKRFYLNLWTEQLKRWLPKEKWDACAGPLDWRALAASLEGRTCFAGLDLSTTTDITAFVMVFAPEAPGEPVKLVPRFWCPAAKVGKAPEHRRVDYGDWVRAGAITATEGDVVDYDKVRAEINRLGEVYHIKEVPADRWNATQIISQLGGDGFTIFPFGQGYASMSGPAKEFETLVLGGGLAHGGHPVLRWMAGNVAITEDAADNIKPAKDKSSDRIDGIVAAIMGVGRALLVPEAEPVPDIAWI